MSSPLDKRGFGWLDLVLALAFALFFGTLSERAYDQAKSARPAQEGRFVGALADPIHVAIDGVYGAFIRESMDGGGVKVHNHQTTEPHEAAMIRPWEYLVGKLAGGGPAAVSDPASAAFHTERRLAILLFALGVGWLAAELLQSFFLRAFAIGMAMLGGNLYGVVEWIGRDSALGLHLRSWLDGGVPNISGLGFSYPALLLGTPHLALEVAFFASAMAGALCATRQLRQAAGNSRFFETVLLCSVALFLLASIRPYTIPVAVLAIFAAFLPTLLGWDQGGRDSRFRAVVALVVIALPTLPLLLHYRGLLHGDSVFSGLDVVHLSPPLLEQVLFFGPPVLLLFAVAPAAVRSYQALSSWSPAALLLGAWLVANLALGNSAPLCSWEVEALLPVSLGVLFLALYWFQEYAKHVFLTWIAMAFVLWLGLSSSGQRLSELEVRLAAGDTALWLTADEAAVVDFLQANRSTTLDANRSPGALVLKPSLARLIPWLSGMRVFTGHPDHTPEYGRKVEFEQRFFRTGQGAALLAKGGVEFVVSTARSAEKEDALDGNQRLERLFWAGILRVDRIQEPKSGLKPSGD